MHLVAQLGNSSALIGEPIQALRAVFLKLEPLLPNFLVSEGLVLFFFLALELFSAVASRAFSKLDMAAILNVYEA